MYDPESQNFRYEMKVGVFMADFGEKTFVVTGGAGFIGSHLIEALLGLDARVRTIDNFSTGKKENIEAVKELIGARSHRLEVVNGDIRDLDLVKSITNGVDGIFHQAALGSVPRSVMDPVTTQNVNVDGTLNVFWSAHLNNVPRVVYASSSSVYGDSEVLPKKEGAEGAPLSPYALTKKINEDHCRLFFGLYGLETVGLRYFNVYGPRQDPESEYAAVIPRFVTRLLNGMAPTIYGSGLQSRDFTFVKDVVLANLLAMTAGSSCCGRAYNIGRGDQVNLLDLLSVLQGLLGTSINPAHEKPRAGDVMHSSADASDAKTLLGFSAECELKDGLALSIDWYKKNLR